MARYTIEVQVREDEGETRTRRSASRVWPSKIPPLHAIAYVIHSILGGPVFAISILCNLAPCGDLELDFSFTIVNSEHRSMGKETNDGLQILR